MYEQSSHEGVDFLLSLCDNVSSDVHWLVTIHDNKVRRRLDPYALVLDQQYPAACEIPNAPTQAPSL